MHESLSNGITLRWSAAHFRPSTDSMVLADFARPAASAAVCDLGCGCGTLSLLLLAAHPRIRVTGIELQPEAAALARENAAQPALQNRFTVLEGDLRDPARLPAGAFDCAVSNPPYYPVASGYAAQNAALRAARTEESCSLPELCRAAGRILRWHGRFFLVHKPERLTDVLCALRAASLEPKRLQFVRHSTQTPASLLLLEAVRGASPGLRLLEDCVLFAPDGVPTPAYTRIYHQEDRSCPPCSV